MNNNNKSIITKLSVFVCLILIGIVLSQYLQTPVVSKKKPLDSIHQVIIDFAKYKADLYLKGDINQEYLNKELECSKYIKKDWKVHSSFFECNPLFYLCKTREEEIFRDKKFKFLGYEIGKKASFIVKYLVEGKPFQIKLKNTCDSTYLPVNLYNAGTKKSNEYLWDNNLQKVYIDKNYFTKLDYAMVNKKDLKNINDPHKPVLNLSLADMRLACSRKGGQLLQNRYFDGAVNFPSKVANKVVRKFPYPWTKRREVRKSATEGDELTSQCLKAYTADCKSIPYIYHSDYAPTWIGIYHSLGSYMEFLDNKFFRAADLKVSSRLIKFDSIWNQNFRRASSKENQAVEKYNDINREYLGKKEWAFRCMYFK